MLCTPVKYSVFNLQFPDYRSQFTIAGYTFTRCEDYNSKIQKLSHHIESYGEFALLPTSGEHALTAIVDTPNEEQESPLAWGEPKTILCDIVLLLAFFTGRDVFVADEGESRPIVRDVRPLLKAETLSASLPQCFDSSGADTAFETELESILDRIHSKEWLSLYTGGQVLFLARQIYTWQILETSFLWSYVLWEHIFLMEKQVGLSKTKINELEKIESVEKVYFLLKKYGFTADLSARQKLKLSQNFTRGRNQLAHFGLFHSNLDIQKNATRWIELTTRLLAVILGLNPTDATCNQRWLDELLMEPPIPVYWCNYI